MKKFRIVMKEEKNISHSECIIKEIYYIEQLTHFFWFKYWKTLLIGGDYMWPVQFDNLYKAEQFLKNYCKQNVIKVIKEIYCEECN